MKVRALRGVCIGVERHLKPGDVADLEPAQVQFLKSIGAVEVVVEPEPAPAGEQPVEPESNSESKQPGKPGRKEK